MFTSRPQVVEMYQAGAWWPGELLGWRHDETGACQVWVRAVVGAVEHTTWTDLVALRLPGRSPEVAGQAPSQRAGEELPAHGSDAGARPRPVDAETTASLPLARDRVSDPARVRPGGRRRAPEDADVRVVAASTVPVPSGRHRASSADPDAGRHRAADTGLLPAVVDGPGPAPRPGEEFPPTVSWTVPAARPAPARETLVDASRGNPADDLLTRPMRLTDQLPHSRRPRLMAH